MLRYLFRNCRKRKPQGLGLAGRRRSGSATVERLPESLEKRFAMSVNTVFAVNGGDDPWATVVTGYGSDAYFQHIGDEDQSLLVSNNASFRGTSQIASGLLQDQVVAIPDFNQSYDTLRVYEGEAIQIAGPVRSPAHPDFEWSDDLTFVLPSVRVDVNTPLRISGVLAVNGRSWEIEQIGATPLARPGFELRSGSESLYVAVSFGSEPGGLTFARFENVAAAVGAGVGDDVSLTLTYDADVSVSANDPDLTASVTATDVLPAANGGMEIQLVALEEGQQLIPGATRGSARLSMTGATIDVAFVASPEPTSPGASTFRVFFSDSGLADREPVLSPDVSVYDNNGQAPFSGRQISGVLDASTGVLALQSDGYVGFEVSQVETALYDYAKAAATEVTLYAGFDHEVGLEISLPSPNSRIQLDSRIDINGPRAGGGTDRDLLVLAASTIEVNAPVRSYRGVIIDDEVNAPLGVTTEEVILNAPLTTPTADIYLRDRADTSTPNRSQLRVGVTGAINTVGDPTQPGRVYVSAEAGDIIVDGEIAADQHTYVMQSSADDASRFKAPFVFSTGSFADGVGRIIGTEVVVTLGNDIFGSQLSTTAFSRVSVDTDVETLRVRAGARRGDESGVPFPYELSVREDNDLIVDAVAASSRSVEIFSGGALSVNSTMRSGGDISLKSDQSVNGNAPIETAFGAISIEAPEVKLRGAVRVLDTIPDERRTDISIRATADDDFDLTTGVPDPALSIRDRVSAVNNVELTALRGSVTGVGVVTADQLLATAAKNIILHTDVHRAKVEIQTPTVTAPGSSGIIALYEEDYIAVDARNAKTVVLAAQGDDAFLRDPRTPDESYQLSSALIARVSDVGTLFATTPSGSVDVAVAASNQVQVGNLNAADIATIRQANPLFQLDTMLAAGSASIIAEDAGEVQLFDAPNALSGAINARFATHSTITSKEVSDNEPVDVRWSPGQPGFDRAELEFTLPVKEVMKLVGYIKENEDVELTPNFLDAWNQDFRESDVILVKDGAELVAGEETENKVNGVYQVAERLYEIAPDGTAFMTVQLVRLQSRDQSSEVSRTHYVKVAKFGDTPASEWVSWQGVSFVGPDSDTSEPYTNIVVRAIDSRPGFTPVKAATTLPIEGSYQTRSESSGEHFGRITSRSEQAIAEASELFGGVVLEEGDLVLVQFGTDQDQNPGALASARTNGIYRVVEKGRNQNAFGLNGKQWELERYQGVDENGDGVIDEVFTGIAAVNQGRLRTSLTGKMFEYSYDAINNGDIGYTKISNGQFLEDPTVPRYEYYQTSVGSKIEGAGIELVVSAASGGNNDGGTMGRMLNLLQQNKTDRAMLLSFDTNLIQQDGGGTQAVVSLTEALPVISRAVAINGNNVIVDGSGIVADKDGQELRGLSGGRYFGPVRPSEVALARRQVLSRAPGAGTAAGNGKNGLEFGANADGSIVRNLRIGGFEEGAAVFIQGADNILLENMVIGGGATEFNVVGKRLTNEYGVSVDSYGDKTGYGVTLRGVSVNDATVVGVNLATGTQGVRIIGSTVGSEDYGNEVGIRVGDVLAEDVVTPAGRYLHEMIGVAGDSNARRLIDQTVTLKQPPGEVGGAQQWLVEVDAELVSAGLRPGLVAYDRVSGRIWNVQSVGPVEAAATEVDVALELQDGHAWNSEHDYESWSAALEFGVLMRLEEGSDVVSIPYGSFDFRNVFLGQEVSFSDPDAFATNPTVRLLLHDQAAFTANLKGDGSGEINVVEVAHAGSGYTPNATFVVTFSAPEGVSGTVAKGTATVDENGKVISVTVTDSGSGYISPPTLAIPLPALPTGPRLELSEPAVRSGWVLATFEVPEGRNDIAFNRTGISLEGPAVRVVQTDVRESIGAGILVKDVQTWDDTQVTAEVAGKPVVEIGGEGVVAERTWSEPDDRNVAVFANRGAGIVLEQGVFEAVGKAILEDFDQAEEFTEEDREKLRSKFSDYVLIAGNYLGKDVTGAEELANGTGVVRNLGTGALTGKAAGFANAIFSGDEGNDVRVDHDDDASEVEKERPLLPEDFVSLERYRALFRPENFEASTDVFTFDPEIGELDPRILLDRAKISELEAIRDRDALSNLHGTVPKYQVGDDSPDDPVGGGDGGGTGSDNDDGGNNWWDDFPILR